MIGKYLTAAGFLGGTLLFAAPALAQNSTTIYRDPGFRGPAVAVDRANPNLQLNFQVFSIRVPRGSWELCPQPNFRGNCLTVRQDTSDLRRAHNWAGPLQSMRPVQGGGGPGGPGGSGGGSGGGWGGQQQSLRGMSTEFFPAPRQGNGRVLACVRGSATANCAAQSADAFCSTRGWRHAVHETMETENRRVYLADVLCSNR